MEKMRQRITIKKSIRKAFLGRRNEGRLDKKRKKRLGDFLFIIKNTKKWWISQWEVA